MRGESSRTLPVRRNPGEYYRFRSNQRTSFRVGRAQVEGGQVYEISPLLQSSEVCGYEAVIWRGPPQGVSGLR